LQTGAAIQIAIALISPGSIESSLPSKLFEYYIPHFSAEFNIIHRILSNPAHIQIKNIPAITSLPFTFWTDLGNNRNSFVEMHRKSSTLEQMELFFAYSFVNFYMCQI